MSDAAVFVRRLFGPPGGAAPHGAELLARAAVVHAELLCRACAQDDRIAARSLEALLAFLHGPAPAAEKRRWLCHPLFIEGLHELAPISPEIQRWHDSVTSPSAANFEARLPAAPTLPPLMGEVCGGGQRVGKETGLGNVDLVLLLRANRQWLGEHDLCTDAFGRVCFPFSDWSLTLHTDRREFLAGHGITLSITRHQASWRTRDPPAAPFLIMSRDDFLRLIIDNQDPAKGFRLQCPHPNLRPRLVRACRLRHSRIRYEPIGFLDSEGHAGLTGGIVASLLWAIRRHSPGVHAELCNFLQAVRGFELPAYAGGVIESFSDPTLPGVMSINVSYTPEQDPCLDPFCFTWFGHELGHTKDYLIDNILYGQGQMLVRNASERTPVLPRYGRSLALRTLFQVPYVHLYEWTLLMDFWEGGFRGLPWRVSADVIAMGEDLAAEVREAFVLIGEQASLTPVGVAALSHLRELFRLALARWHAVVLRHRHR